MKRRLENENVNEEILHFKQFSCTDYNTIGITHTNDVYICGLSSGYEQSILGNLIPSCCVNPVKLKKKFIKIVLGVHCSFGIDEIYKWYAFGSNEYHQFGAPTLKDQIFQEVKPNFKKLFISTFSAFGIDYNGYVHSWGCNTCGQLGIGTNDYGNVEYSYDQHKLDFKFKKIICGTNFAFGILEDGTTYSWGHNDNGQLGLGCFDDKYSPTNIGMKFKRIYCSHLFHVYGIDYNNNAYEWGITSAFPSKLNYVCKSFVCNEDSTLGVGYNNQFFWVGRNNLNSSLESTINDFGCNFNKILINHTSFFGINKFGEVFHWGSSRITNGIYLQLKPVKTRFVITKLQSRFTKTKLNLFANLNSNTLTNVQFEFNLF